MDVVETTCVIALLLRAKSKRRKHRYWVHPITSQRLLKRQFYKLFQDLREHPKKFFQYYRMSKNSFDELLRINGPSITYKDTTWRKSIPPEERLSVTIRYLATGNSFNALHFEYLLGASTIGHIVKDTCAKLWKCLQPIHMSEKTEDDWKETSKQFYLRTNFPNCIGAIDGKHIRLQKPFNSGSLFFNYKNFFSIVLLALIDADYCFTAIDVGSYGANTDSNIFKNSTLGKKLNAGNLNIPQAQALPYGENGKPMPFVIVCDEAFAQSKHIMRPYSKRNLSMKQRVCNYRICRARRMVECTFGILANKWRIFHRPLDVQIELADDIVKSCCILHNFVRRKDGICIEDECYECPMQEVSQNGLRADSAGAEVKDHFANYFISPQGSVHWQYDSV